MRVYREFCGSPFGHEENFSRLNFFTSGCTPGFLLKIYHETRREANTNVVDELREIDDII